MITFVIERLIGLIGLIGPVANLTKERRELRDNALHSICHALDQTCLYCRDIDRGEPRNLGTEAQLATYWSAAAIPVRHFDRELAEICEYKSEYWLNPETWDSKANKVEIDLDNGELCL